MYFEMFISAIQLLFEKKTDKLILLGLTCMRTGQIIEFFSPVSELYSTSVLSFFLNKRIKRAFGTKQIYKEMLI